MQGFNIWRGGQERNLKPPGGKGVGVGTSK